MLELFVVNSHRSKGTIIEDTGTGYRVRGYMSGKLRVIVPPLIETLYDDYMAEQGD